MIYLYQALIFKFLIKWLNNLYLIINKNIAQTDIIFYFLDTNIIILDDKV